MIAARIVVILVLFIACSIPAWSKAPLKKSPLGKSQRIKKFKGTDQFDREDALGSEQTLVATSLEKLTDFLKYEASVFRSVAKSALDVISVKHVSYLQILGKWKIYQDINVGNDEDVLSYPVSVELLENGTVVTRRNGEEHMAPFKFTERQWPQKCSIEFELKTFDSDGGSVSSAPLLYKGYFKRSLLNNLIVIMKGSLYKTSGKSL